MLNDILSMGATGMNAYSRQLKAISNNVSNLNTAGYKSTSVRFTDIFNGGGANTMGRNLGGGVATTTTLVNFRGGDSVLTGQDLHLKSNGNGFFILRDEDGGESYTRDGAFEFKNGILVNPEGKRVMALNEFGVLGEVNIKDLEANAAKATTKLSFSSPVTLSLNASQATAGSVVVFDAAGGSHTLSVSFALKTPASTGASSTWEMTIKDGTTPVASALLNFDAAGAPLADSSKVNFVYRPGGLGEFSIDLETNNLSSRTGTTASPSLSLVADGNAAGILATKAFDTKGNLILGYNNQQTVTKFKIALALFGSTSNLEERGNATFVNTGREKARIGVAGTEFGEFVLKSVENSNVNLTDEFTSLISAQRGYQALANVVTTVNEMMQTALKAKGG